MPGRGSREAALLVCLQLIFHKTCVPECLLWSPQRPPLTRKGPGWEALGAVRRKGVGGRASLFEILQPWHRVVITFSQSPHYLRHPYVHENKSRSNPTQGRGGGKGLGRARGRHFFLPPPQSSVSQFLSFPSTHVFSFADSPQKYWLCELLLRKPGNWNHTI